MLPFQHEIRPSTRNKHATVAEMEQHQIKKPMKLSQLEKRSAQTLTNSKDINQKSRCAEATWADQRAAAQMRPGFRTNQIHPGGPGVTFLGTDT